MVEKVIKALRNFGLNTHFGPHSLSKDEIKKIEFRSQRVFNALLKTGYFIEVAANTDIPVIRPKVDEDTIVRIDPDDEVDPPGGIDPDKPDLPCPEEDQKPTIEELEAILDSEEKTSIETLPNGEIRAVKVPLDEAGEPEEKETPGDQKRSESSQEILEDLSQMDTPQTEEEVERAATEGMVEMGSEEQSVEEVCVEEIDYRDSTTARPTDTPDVPDVLNESEVEEIPIEEQDENKPELESDAPWREGTPEFEGKSERVDEFVEPINEQDESDLELESDEA